MAVTSIARPEAGEYPTAFRKYVDRVPPGSVLDLLRRQVAEVVDFFDRLPDAAADHRYAPGKWSVKEVLGHVVDTERILACRALRFARGETTALPGFDQNAYVEAADSDRRTLASLTDEFTGVRRSNIALFESFGVETWRRSGVANGARCTVRAIAYVLAGHAAHHLALIEERYL